MKEIMAQMRSNPRNSYAGLKVLAVEDYLAGYKDYPKSDALRIRLENNCWVCVRPSGTEPKIKFYFGANGKTAAQADAINEQLKKEMTAGM